MGTNLEILEKSSKFYPILYSFISKRSELNVFDWFTRFSFGDFFGDFGFKNIIFQPPFSFLFEIGKLFNKLLFCQDFGLSWYKTYIPSFFQWIRVWNLLFSSFSSRNSFCVELLIPLFEIPKNSRINSKFILFIRVKKTFCGLIWAF